MYEIREVIVKNGPHERSVWVINFDDPAMDIISEFLMTDAQFMNYRILEDLNDALSGEKSEVVTSGNRCSLKITAKETKVDDMFVGLFDDFDTFDSCKIDTKRLRDLVILWRDRTEGG